MRARYQVLLEVPIAEKDARRRKLPKDVSKLVVGLDTDDPIANENAFDSLARCISLWKVNSEHVYTIAIAPFVSRKDIIGGFQESHLFGEISALSTGDFIIPCATERAVVLAMSICRSEALVFVYGSVNGSDMGRLASIVEEGRGQSQYEIPFMKHRECYGGFIFFAESHLSLEVLGTAGFVLWRCLVPLAKDVVPMKTRAAGFQTPPGVRRDC